jgi:hypothetical protein
MPTSFFEVFLYLVGIYYLTLLIRPKWVFRLNYWPINMGIVLLGALTLGVNSFVERRKKRKV